MTSPRCGARRHVPLATSSVDSINFDIHLRPAYADGLVRLKADATHCRGVLQRCAEPAHLSVRDRDRLLRAKRGRNQVGAPADPNRARFAR